MFITHYSRLFGEWIHVYSCFSFSLSSHIYQLLQSLMVVSQSVSNIFQLNPILPLAANSQSILFRHNPLSFFNVAKIHSLINSQATYTWSLTIQTVFLCSKYRTCYFILRCVFFILVLPFLTYCKWICANLLSCHATYTT